MKTEPVAVTRTAAHPQLKLYEIPQRLGVTTLVFVVMGVNLRNAVEKTCKLRFSFRTNFSV